MKGDSFLKNLLRKWSPFNIGKIKLFLRFFLITTIAIAAYVFFHAYAFGEEKGNLFQFALFFSSSILAFEAWLVLRVIKKREITKGA